VSVNDGVLCVYVNLTLHDEQTIIYDLEEVSPQHLHIFQVAKNYNVRCTRISVDLLLTARLTWEGKQRLCEMCVYKIYISPSRLFTS
jgi:hypothetical protein